MGDSLKEIFYHDILFLFKLFFAKKSFLQMMMMMIMMITI